MKLIFMNNKKSALSIIKGIFCNTNYFEWIGPRCFNIWGKPSIKKLKTCSEYESEKIFKIAEKQPNIKSAAKYLPTKTGN
jgi:hypothetical protein